MTQADIDRLRRRAFWDGFWSVFAYMGAFACLAPVWMKDWERPMQRMLKNGIGIKDETE